MIKKIILTAIIATAVFLRFYSLSTNPPALTWDEASWGYNAYTLGMTGKDEFGKFLPVTYLESFGDFKPPMYAYLSVIPTMIFGLNEFSTRFASAFLGSLTVFLAYFLVLEIFYSSGKKKYLAVGAAFLLAISPWHILLSRAAFEANVASFFIVLGIFLFLFSTRDRKHLKFLAISLLLFAAATYTFNTSRVFLPLFVSFLFILKRKMLLEHWRFMFIGLIPAILVSIPLLLFLVTPQAKLRYEEVNIFSDIKVIERVNQQILNDNNSKLSKAIHNRRLAYSVEYVKHYLDNLDPGFLFIHGDGNPKFSVQDVGQMYIWELPFLIIGSFLLFRKREGNWMILPLWFILGIVPAATARETPHALRIETILPVPQMLVAYGMLYSYEFLSRVKSYILYVKTKYIIFFLFLICFLFNLLYFLHTYFVHYPGTYAAEWQYGYKQAVSYAESQKSNYKKIYMTNDLGRPYIYVLFYGKYPQNTLKNAQIKREALGFVHVNRFEKYTFSDNLPYGQEDTLYINSPNKVPSNAHVLKQFLLPDKTPILIAYTK